MDLLVHFAKTKEEAVIPTKRGEDAAYDVYPCFEADCIFIEPHTTVTVPTGIASACDTGYCFILKERGSVGSKGIAVRCGVIDSGYRGEWFVGITNTTDKKVVICKADADISDEELKKSVIIPYERAIAQALIVPVPKAGTIEIAYKELKQIRSERGTGKLGSSGK